MIEKSNKCLDRNGVFGALLADLLKPFDCLPHSLLITKLQAYGFDRTSIEYLKRLFGSSETKDKNKWDVYLLDKYTTWNNTRLYIGSTTF